MPAQSAASDLSRVTEAAAEEASKLTPSEELEREARPAVGGAGRNLRLYTPKFGRRPREEEEEAAATASEP